MNGITLPADAVLDIAIRLGRSSVLAQKPTRVQVLIETRPNTRTQHQTAPTDLRLVIDVSGSMASRSGQGVESKLDLVKTAVLKLLAQLGGKDHVTVSVFSTLGRLLVPATKVNDKGRKKIAKAIAALEPETQTNVSAGLEIALAPSIVRGTLPRVILFTDGQSSFHSTDHPRLVELADEARGAEIPLSIYGTGSDYNWSLLQQVAIRAGGGSFCKHVLDVAALEGHMLGELAFLRGTAIDRFQIEGLVPHTAVIISATSMMPQIQQLEVVNHRWFEDRTGALDLHRGAQYLVEIEVTDPTVGSLDVLSLTLRGRTRSTLIPFEYTVAVPVTFVAKPQQETPPNEQVRKVQLMVLASRRAQEGSYEQASELYSLAGDEATSVRMKNLHTATQRPGADTVDIGREATTLAHGSVTEVYTIDPSQGKK